MSTQDGRNPSVGVPQLIGEVLILGYVSERLWLMIRQDVNPDGWMQQLWHKCTTSAECKTIRIAASAVMDSWMASVGRCFLKMTCDLKDEN